MPKRNWRELWKRTMAILGLWSFNFSIATIGFLLALFAAHFIYGRSIPLQRDLIILAVAVSVIAAILVLRATESLMLSVSKVSAYCLLLATVFIAAGLARTRLKQGTFTALDLEVMLGCVAVYLPCHIYLKRVDAFPKRFTGNLVRPS